MIGIYLPNMEMPKEGYRLLLLHSDGTVQSTVGETKAVPVPPHGDLIDREPFVQFIKTHWDSYDQWFVEQLEARPTIIPADPAEEGET